MQKNKEWFEVWFDSDYYHILYRHRDDREAESFMDHIKAFLDLTPTDKILDLACGKGRHAIYLNRLGLNVTGLDLSVQNITHARPFENERLRFYVHDMRRIWKKNYFDYVFNLFTSFGYFNTHMEHSRVIRAMAGNLKPGGKILIDFMNTAKVVRNIVPEEVKTVEGMTFHMKKKLEKGFIIKIITVRDGSKTKVFMERVKAIFYRDFCSYFKDAWMKIEHMFGDYDLNPYVSGQSDRMIFLAKKALS